VALQLQKRGITRVRPLLGGLDAWTALEYPVEKVAITVESSQHSAVSTQ
jgi:3-mercaptopyruvate sulfurtransferase SseA